MPFKSDEPELPAFFDKNPQLKERLLTYLRSIPESEKKRNVELFQKFISGELTWAEIKSVPKALLKELARVAYMKLQHKDFRGAEILFKGLAIIDHTNWYYRAALGAVFQRQAQFEAAIDEYTIALTLKSDEVTALVNRGECYVRLGDLDAALQDFAAVETLGLAEENPWKKRARLLSQRTLEQKSKG